ncbi:ankyrin repeat and SAM domain-containing protein 4B-like [Stegodyphus dumicola]|uniref:ankyrin repeat and SAM domain-containing protein 4B-like n=1 Tax=Stegodyphus dumicola TaxID=202533 RepID=UPI0015ACB8B0|nr:ankyrin repeat and SAM domain-containing protein 4B-like [Stegodyphus dumicola]
MARFLLPPPESVNWGSPKWDIMEFHFRGDPDKCDHYGNTSLHCAAGNGHIDCVSFLVNFGVNLWALDNDFHTAKDVAVLNHKNDVLRLLDQAQSKHALVNKKLVQRLKEKSVYDAEKRIKNYKKLQMKAAKRAEKEEKERQSDVQRLMLPSFRKDSRFLYAPKFSDIVSVGEKKDHGAVAKKAAVGKKKKNVVFRPGDIIGRDDELDSTAECHSQLKPFLKRNEIIHRNHLYSVKESDDGTSSPDNPSRQTSDTHSSDDANSDFLQTADSGIGEELQDTGSPHASIFDRPGFGTVTFRNAIINLTTLTNSNNTHENFEKNRGELSCRNSKSEFSTLNDSIGSASSLVRRHITWEDECEADDYDDADDDATDDDVTDEEDCDATEPLSLFLTSIGLSEYMPLFQTERIDLESLSLLSEEDLKALGMPLGPRRKLGKALQQRIKILEEPGIVQDSRL